MARDILNDFAPDIAIGVGGYASGPMLKAAQKRGIPTLIQEQNSYAGVTNKLLAKKADRICVAYSGMERFFPAESIVFTGNPVRQNLLDQSVSREEAVKSFGLDPTKRTILIVGGSLGAKTLNDSVLGSISLIRQQKNDIFLKVARFTKLYAFVCQFRHILKAPILQGFSNFHKARSFSSISIASEFLPADAGHRLSVPGPVQIP